MLDGAPVEGARWWSCAVCDRGWEPLLAGRPWPMIESSEPSTGGCCEALSTLPPGLACWGQHTPRKKGCAVTRDAPTSLG